MMILVILILLILVGFQLIGYMLSAPKYKGPVSDHFNGKQFINPGNVKAKGPRDVIKWMRERKRSPWNETSPPTQGAKPAERIYDGARITFINHSTFLIQTKGLNILTDPVYSERVSPFSWAGPKRMRPPGIAFEDLPMIDVILLSHNHYDHLDISTVKKLNQKFHPRFILPLGVGAFLKQHKIEKYQELDWWQSTTVANQIKVTATPAQHFSGRGFFDRDATLWCGFILETDAIQIYFAGDTGYNPNTFKEIGEKHKAIDVALIPVGAYKPTWFMSPIHCSPQEAVKIHQEVKARKSIATHYGTFPLADEGPSEAKDDFAAAKKACNVGDDDFIMLPEGTYNDF